MGFIVVTQLRTESRKAKPPPCSSESSGDSIKSDSSSFRKSKFRDIIRTNSIRLLYTKKASLSFVSRPDCRPPISASPIKPPTRASSSARSKPPARLSCPTSSEVLDITSETLHFPLPPQSSSSPKTSFNHNLEPSVPRSSARTTKTQSRGAVTPSPRSKSRSRRASRRRRMASTIYAITDDDEPPPSATSRFSRISAFTWVDDHLQDLEVSFADGVDGGHFTSKRDSLILPTSFLEDTRYPFQAKSLPTPPPCNNTPRPRPLPIPTPPSSPSPSQSTFRRIRPLPSLPTP